MQTSFKIISFVFNYFLFIFASKIFQGPANSDPGGLRRNTQNNLVFPFIPFHSIYSGRLGNYSDQKLGAGSGKKFYKIV